MVLLVCFDLPRETKRERKQAAEYRKRLVELGFSMKQYSLYEVGSVFCKMKVQKFAAQ